MQWLQNLNDALTYIENNLDGEISYQKAARLGGCSTYHFQRMFAYISGVPLSEYIRRRRLTKAAFDLQRGDKVLDVALRYGYESPTSFNRAFCNLHGMAPSLARKQGSALKAYPRMTFSMTIKGDQEMDYRIEKKEAFATIGVKLSLEKDSDSSFERIPRFWSQKQQDGAIARLCSLMGEKPEGLFGICSSQENLPQWNYYIAVTSSAAIVPQGFERYTVPAATWAVFPGKGAMPQAIQNLQKQILREWLPTSNYELGTAPDIEVYLSEDPTDQRFEVWLPIKSKG